MKIQYCSDLHIEFQTNTLFLSKYPLKPIAEVLILAGDITYLRKDFYEHPFFDYVSENWKIVFWIPGNHEFYCGIDMLNYDFSEPIKIRKNILLVNNITLKIEDINIIFSTFWSKIDKLHKKFIENNVSDFHAIVYNEQKLSANKFNELHKEALYFIENECEKLKNEKKIVVTHHLPSNYCNHKDFQGSKLNSAFCTDLTDFVNKCEADYWIYGHSHRNMPEFLIGKTKMLTNQLGYIQLKENESFKFDAFFEI